VTSLRDIIRKITYGSEVFSFLAGDIIKSRSVTINLICGWSFHERHNNFENKQNSKYFEFLKPSEFQISFVRIMNMIARNIEAFTMTNRIKTVFDFNLYPE
jgi:hypothetical protein